MIEDKLVRLRLSINDFRKKITQIIEEESNYEVMISRITKLYEENDSFINAQNWSRQKAFLENKEIDCPLCKRKIKMYHRKLNSGMMGFLIGLYSISSGDYGIEVHYSDVMKKIGFMPNDFANMERWGLIQPGISAGMWMLTKKGILFIKGEISIPSKVHIYNDKTWGFDSNEVSFTETLGKRFELLDLLKDKTFFAGDKTKILK